MALCNVCQEHIKTRYRYVLTTKEPVPLVNIPKQYLQTFADSDLSKIKNNAMTGIMVCKDCRSLCSRNLEECKIPYKVMGNKLYYDTDKIRVLLKSIDLRNYEDTKVIQDVNNEIIRRQNIMRILATIKK